MSSRETAVKVTHLEEVCAPGLPIIEDGVLIEFQHSKLGKTTFERRRSQALWMVSNFQRCFGIYINPGAPFNAHGPRPQSPPLAEVVKTTLDLAFQSQLINHDFVRELLFDEPRDDRELQIVKRGCTAQIIGARKVRESNRRLDLGHVEYRIEIMTPGATWTVYRRYSEFKALLKDLLEDYQDTFGQVLQMPQSKNEPTRRRNGLQALLKVIMGDNQLRVHEASQKFFAVTPEAAAEHDDACNGRTVVDDVF